MTRGPSWWPSAEEWAQLTDEQRRMVERRLYETLGLRLRYSPFFPHPKQAAFLSLSEYREVFYGGAAGPGKSTALLMAALQYVDVPGYSAIIFRRTYQDLSLPGALMDKAREWLAGSDARWSMTHHQWIFPSSAKLQFGYLEHEQDKLRYKGAEFQFVGFDELTDFTNTQYRYLFSRCRKSENAEFYGSAIDGMSLAQVPLRIRSASNPGGKGHVWVKRRLVDNEAAEAGRVFIKARIEDNPSLDKEEYESMLAELPPLEAAQLMRGDWEVTSEGSLFKRADLMSHIIPAAECPELTVEVRAWDTAATEASSENPDPDWTVGVKVGVRADGKGFVVTDVQRFRRGPGDVEDLIQECADEIDGATVAIRLNLDPGSAGKIAAGVIMDRLYGYAVDAQRETGTKDVRAKPAAAMSQRGKLWLLDGAWLDDAVDELADFPGGDHDDIVDALSAAVDYLRENRPGQVATVSGELRTGLVP